MPPRKKIKAVTFDDHVSRVVESKRVKAGLTVDELAERIGVSLSTMTRRLSGSGFTVLEFEMVAGAVGVPAATMLAEALDDYGGMGKLLSDHGPVSEVKPTVEDNVTYLGKVRPGLRDAADENPHPKGSD